MKTLKNKCSHLCIKLHFFDCNIISIQRHTSKGWTLLALFGFSDRNPTCGNL